MKNYFKRNIVLLIILALLSFSIIFIKKTYPKVEKVYTENKKNKYEELLKEKKIEYYKILDHYYSSYEKIYINDSHEAAIFINNFINYKKLIDIDYSKNTVFIVHDVRNNGCTAKDVRVLVADFEKKKINIYFKTILESNERICTQVITSDTYAVVVPNTLIKEKDISDWKLPSKAYQERIE